MDCTSEGCDGIWHPCQECGGNGVYVNDEGRSIEYGCFGCDGSGRIPCSAYDEQLGRRIQEAIDSKARTE